MGVHLATVSALIPASGRLTLDVGCGEGRLGRVLQEAGHELIGVDVTFALARAAKSHAQPLPALVADAAHLPFRDRAADLVVAFMSLQDIDDLAGAVHEAARVLEPGGRFCVAIPHPVADSGGFRDDGAFLLDRSYLGVWRYPDVSSAALREVPFHSEHRPIESYSRAFEEAGFLVEAFREPALDAATSGNLPSGKQWRRIPRLLMMRARLY